MYCCGPEGLLSAVEDACKTWPDGSLHIERFSAKALDEPSPDALEPSRWNANAPGVTLTVPADKSIYEAARKPALTCSAPAWKVSAAPVNAT